MGDLKRDSLDDIHDHMSWWACFNRKEPVTTPSHDFAVPPPDFTFNPKTKTGYKKAKKKQRKKMAKASRKKNRR